MNIKLVMLAILALTSSAWATCDHPYSPAALGMSWTFSNKMVGEDFDTITRVVSTDTQSYATETLTETSSVREKVTCHPDGSLRIASYISNFALDGWSFKYANVSYSGVNIPAPQLWVVGTQWTYASTIKSVSGYETAPVVETTSERVDSKIVGSELITVAAGEFTALKVIQTTYSYRKIVKNRLTTTSKETRTDTVWFARGIGPVKYSGKDYMIKLTKFVKP